MYVIIDLAAARHAWYRNAYDAMVVVGPFNTYTEARDYVYKDQDLNMDQVAISEVLQPPPQ